MLLKKTGTISLTLTIFYLSLFAGASFAHQLQVDDNGATGCLAYHAVG